MAMFAQAIWPPFFWQEQRRGDSIPFFNMCLLVA